jgi:hypothetical protein
MIFFSDDIRNEIVDNSPLEEIMNKLEEFRNDNEMIFTYFNYGSIGIDYIENLLKYESNKVAYYCNDEKFVIRSCPSCMIYSKQNQKNSDTIMYYIMVISTDRETKNSSKKVKIVLSSLDEVVSYYQKYGFEVADCSFDNYPYFKYFEKYDDEKLCTIMELDIK